MGLSYRFRTWKWERPHIVEMALSKYYSLRPLLGYEDTWFYVIIGARGCGKTFSTLDFFLRKWKKEKIPFVWIRLSKISVDELLANNAELFIPQELVKRYDLHLTTRGMDVFDGEERMARIISLSESAKHKGSAMFDMDEGDAFHCCVDEVAREPNERVLFNLVYNLSSILETMCRFKNDKIKIIMTCNALSANNEICANFNFLPTEHGIYRLKKKKAVIHFVPDSEDYREKRKDTVGGILQGTQSNFTNKIEVDRSLLYTKRLRKPWCLIKFSKDSRDWYVVWDDNVIKRYNKEKLGFVIAMRPRLDEIYRKKDMEAIVSNYNMRNYRFVDLATQIVFENELALLKPRG